ncbi:Neutral ceramidase precursor [Polystyrenella longa]|uniref:Neutral ceramidase n=1 Tax=Polystyrenella longa TaxID=2528007 RepID=A0A518CPH3_9PLAN|nr:neutral/alkaline non-lysosomal ceramidase N-terminal domain-containing protein [Polystyrenella longa]QDU81122.1 Neutral ceramidase precursor [Polystyrenella longa]
MMFLSRIRVLTVATGLLLIVSLFAGSVEAQAGWKAGLAEANITPETAMWMAGYGGRSKPATGKRQDLWVKVAAIEDESGNRAVIFSTDLLGIPQSIYNNVCAELESKHQLSRSQIMLNSSHTHSGPVLRGALHDIYPLDEHLLDLIEDYSNKLENTLVNIAGEALESLAPATLRAGNGSADFAVNRRNNSEGAVPSLREKGEALAGPVDHDVPVLAIYNDKKELTAVIFGYACHNTVMGDYLWHGDYAGFAQAAFEEKHPGVTALFYMGCGGDQNPIPRREEKLLTVYGEKLANAVDQVVSDDSQLTTLSPKLETTHQFVELHLADQPTADELQEIIDNPNRAEYQKRWASRLLKEMEDGTTFVTSYPLPIQAWELGDQQLWLTIGGEVTVDYSLGFKKMFGKQTWVAGYCNDVPAYIPSLRVLEEDKVKMGYEGHSSMMVYGLPAFRWADDVEDQIANGMTELVKQVRP